MNVWNNRISIGFQWVNSINGKPIKISGIFTRRKNTHIKDKFTENGFTHARGVIVLPFYFLIQFFLLTVKSERRIRTMDKSRNEKEALCRWRWCIVKRLIEFRALTKLDLEQIILEIDLIHEKTHTHIYNDSTSICVSSILLMVTFKSIGRFAPCFVTIYAI